MQLNRTKTRRLIIIMMVIALTSLIASEDDPYAALEKSDTLQIHLQEAILFALEHNPTITIQRLEPQIAKTYILEQSSVYDPTITLNATRDETRLQRFLGSRPEPFEMTTTRSQYDAAITQQLPTGTTLSATGNLSSTVSSIYSDQYTGRVGVTITQSLLNGFWIGANLANLRKAKLDMAISRIELKAVAEGITADVENAYWDLYLASQENKIQQSSLALAEQQLQESIERVAVGKLPELELAAVHAELATRQEGLIDARSRYEQARLHFLYLLNRQQEKPWSILPIPIDRPFVPTDTLDTIDVHEQLATKYRPELQQAQLNYDKNKLDIVQTRNGLLPKLDLFISLGRTTYAGSFNESLPDIHSPFYDASVGLSFEFPLPNREARANHARTFYTREQLQISLENMQRLVQRDVRSAYVEVLRSRQQIKATQVAHELQQKKLTAEQEKFRVGKSTNYLVLQAQRDLTASQLNEARAMVSYLNALVDLYFMEGTLLQRRGIHAFRE